MWRTHGPDSLQRAWDNVAWFFAASSFFPGSWRLWANSLISPLKDKAIFELWLDAMDFSSIHTLHLNSTIALSFSRDGLLPTKLPKLHTLVVEGFQARDFILALPPNSLEHLT